MSPVLTAPDSLISIADVIGPVTKDVLLADQRRLEREIETREAARLTIDRELTDIREKLTKAMEARAIFERHERVTRRNERNAEIDRFYDERVDEASKIRQRADLTISPLGMDRYDANPNRTFRLVTIDYPSGEDAGDTVFLRERFSVPTDAEGYEAIEELLSNNGYTPEMQLDPEHGEAFDRHELYEIFTEIDNRSWPVQQEHTYATEVELNLSSATDAAAGHYLVVPRALAKFRTMMDETDVFEGTDPTYSPLVEGGVLDRLRNPPQQKSTAEQVIPVPGQGLVARLLQRIF